MVEDSSMQAVIIKWKTLDGRFFDEVHDVNYYDAEYTIYWRNTPIYNIHSGRIG